MPAHDQALGLLHGGDALRRPDVLDGAVVTEPLIVRQLDRIADAEAAAVHSGAQRGVRRAAADGPVVGILLALYIILIIPIINGGGIGNDADAALRPDKVHRGVFVGVIDVVGGVVPIHGEHGIVGAGAVEGIALDIAIVLDVQVAGGVHRQHLAAAPQANVADDILVGEYRQAGFVQQLHTGGADGAVDPAPGAAVEALAGV